MKLYLLIPIILLTITTYAQNTINNYKYVLVPAQFEFSKETDQYGLNTATKMMLEQKGFVVFLNNQQLPPELAANKCNALMADVVQKKAFLVTNLSLVLKDCQGNVVFKSKEGKSREKEFRPAFNLALHDAFTSLNAVPYKYDSSIATTSPVQPQQPAATASSAAPVSTAPASPASPVAGASAATEITGTLYAQATANGYQLVDMTPKKVLTLLKSSTPDHYIAQAGSTSGIVFKKNNEWFFEYYKDDKLVSQKLEIKF